MNHCEGSIKRYPGIWQLPYANSQNLWKVSLSLRCTCCFVSNKVLFAFWNWFSEEDIAEKSKAFWSCVIRKVHSLLGGLFIYSQIYTAYQLCINRCVSLWRYNFNTKHMLLSSQKWQPNGNAKTQAIMTQDGSCSCSCSCDNGAEAMRAAPLPGLGH